MFAMKRSSCVCKWTRNGEIHTHTHSEKYSHTLIHLFTHSQRKSGRRHLNNNNGIEKETISNDIAKCWVHRQLALAYSVKSELIWSTVTTTTTTQGGAGQSRTGRGRAGHNDSAVVPCAQWVVPSAVAAAAAELLYPDPLPYPCCLLFYCGLTLCCCLGALTCERRIEAQLMLVGLDASFLCPPVAFLPSDETAHCLAAHSIQLFLSLSPLELIISQKEKKTPAAFCRAWHMVTKHAKKTPSFTPN